jgi:hypothetical protein
MLRQGCTCHDENDHRVAQRSEHWMRKAVNEHGDALNSLVTSVFGWDASERIEWLSPIASDAYAEYYDEEFIDRLRISGLNTSATN